MPNIKCVVQGCPFYSMIIPNSCTKSDITISPLLLPTGDADILVGYACTEGTTKLYQLMEPQDEENSQGELFQDTQERTPAEVHGEEER